jgi:hypothetical protein
VVVFTIGVEHWCQPGTVKNIRDESLKINDGGNQAGWQSESD